MSHPPYTILPAKGKQVTHRMNIRLAQSRDSIKTVFFIAQTIKRGEFARAFGRIPLLLTLIRQGR